MITYYENVLYMKFYQFESQYLAKYSSDHNDVTDYNDVILFLS